jgi:hypothetical protein
MHHQHHQADRVRRDLRRDPHGDQMSIVEAARALDCAPGKVAQRVQDGTWAGTVEDNRAVSVERADVAAALGLR